MKKLLIVSLLSTSIGNAAIASETIDNFVSAGYSVLNMDEIEGDFSGYKLAGEYALSDRFYLSGKYQDNSADGRNQIFSDINVGKKSAITESTTWFLEAGYAVIKLQRQDAGDFKGSGFHGATGIEMSINDQFSVGARVDFTDVGKVDNLYGDYSETEFGVNADYHFSDDFSVYAEYSQSKTQDNSSIGLKYNF